MKKLFKAIYIASLIYAFLILCGDCENFTLFVVSKLTALVYMLIGIYLYREVIFREVGDE